MRHSLPSTDKLRALLGLKPKAMLPAEGMGWRRVTLPDGRRVWLRVLPAEAPTLTKQGRPRRRMRHRLVATCPHCRAEVPAGRYGQHVKPCEQRGGGLNY